MSVAILPAYDEKAVRLHVGMVHISARGIEDDVVVAAYGEDPAIPDEVTGKPGRKIPGFVRRYAVGDAGRTRRSDRARPLRHRGGPQRGAERVRDGL